MKTNNKILLGLLGVLALTTGCKEKMIELNTNPNTVSDTKVQFLFTNATDKYGYEERGSLIGKFSGEMQLMQYVSNNDAPGGPTQEVGNPTGSALESWTIDYKRLLNSGPKFKHIIDYIDKANETTKKENSDIRAIAEFMYVNAQWKVLKQFGAFPYSDAFLATETGNLKPKYQRLQDKLENGTPIWQDLDNRLAASIKVLEAPAIEGAVALGENDFFNGWWKGAKTTAATQRANWLKFANMARLEMAWTLKAVQPANFTKVLAEVLAVKNGLMTKIEDGTYYNYAWNYDDGPDDVNAISEYYSTGESFTNLLLKRNDPRLPLLARTAATNATSSRNFRAVQALYPDSIANYTVMNGTSYFVGQSNNPKVATKQFFIQADKQSYNFVGRINKQFNFINPNGEAVLDFTDPKTGKKDTVAKTKKFDLSIQMTSLPQGRYFVKCGGRLEKNGPLNYVDKNNNEYRFDGKGGEFANLRLRRPVFTYAKQCFMLAMLDVTAGGKSPQQWYEEGVKTAFVELQQDADYYDIQIATNAEWPKLPGLNDGLYSYSASDISNYIAANPYTGEEKVMEQAWIYFFQQPETMYDWHLLTGYPTMKEHATPVLAAAENGDRKSVV